MKILLIYNKESEVERSIFNRIREELGTYIHAEYDFQEVKNIIPIRATPAFIIIRDDLQGEELLDDGDVELRITAEITKIMQEEDMNIHQKETKRLDQLIEAEKQKAVEKALKDKEEK